MSEFSIEPLDSFRHRRNEFSCESVALTAFIRERARKEMEAGVSACFVLVPKSDPGRIAGYYTLSAAEIVTTDLPESMAKKLPRYNGLPATLLGRLARDSSFRGQGTGDLLMFNALARAEKTSYEIGSIAVITDPKDAKAASFYREFGFSDLKPPRLFMPMKDIKRFLKSRS